MFTMQYDWFGSRTWEEVGKHQARGKRKDCPAKWPSSWFKNETAFQSGYIHTATVYSYQSCLQCKAQNIGTMSVTGQ